MEDLKRGLNLLGFLVVVVINALGAAGIFFGNSQADISNRYKTLITPAGFAFAIWGVIYFFQACFVIWNILPQQRYNYVLQHGVSWYFILSCIFNSAWIIVFSIGTVVAVQISSALICFLLVCILLIYVSAQCWIRPNTTWGEFLFVDVTTSLYASWVTVATILNIALAFVAGGNVESLWNIDAASWAIAMLVVAMIINILVIVTRRDFIYPLVLAWATFAIRQESEIPDVKLSAGIISLMALIFAVIVIIYRIYSCNRDDNSQSGRNAHEESGKPLYEAEKTKHIAYT